MDSLFVIDANVLIDYARSDVTVLALVSRHLGAIHVPQELLAEVEQLDESECERLGLRVVEATLDQLLEAGRLRGKGGLSFQDHLCLCMARDEGGICITNDGPLRRACGEQRVPVSWGLELMVALVAGRHLPAEEAVRIARAIHESNPRYINARVLGDFIKKVESGK